MTGIREHPPPTAAPAAPATEATRPGRVAGLDGIRGPGGPLRGAQPHLRARLAGLPIEAQRYVLLPLLLLLVRRVSARAMVGLVAAIVVTIGVLGPHVPLMNSALVKFVPDLAVLFAVGLLSAAIVTALEAHPIPALGLVMRWPPRRPSSR